MQERTLYTDELYPFYKTDKVEGNTPTSEIMITLTDAEAIGLDLAMSMFESWQTMLKERYEVKMQSRAKGDGSEASTLDVRDSSSGLAQENK